METDNRCGDCLWCMKDEGEPYYCVLRDLYYFVAPNDRACKNFVADKGEVEKIFTNY